MTLSNSNPRHLPCALLRSQGIRCVVWFEDAIAHYGVPTAVFDLADGLSCNENKRLETPCMQYALSPPTQNSIRRAGELPGPTTTVLLRAEDWNFDLEQHCSPDTVIPPLAPLLDALIDSWLDSPDDNLMLRMHLGCMIAYLYGYAPELQQETFAAQLKKEHRQYHYDVRSEMTTGTAPFLNRQRQVREESRKAQQSIPKRDQA
ncbi:uncharacterized protein Z518_00567 [Rhinocladiella mackenziei CBS 650.93]|uniref:Uncharacterized protein n=1 Tax=Rhinocladiella mackenziei CBS 650.93 TaxID=1442369 RepID=A0A0D2G4B2_9EURO|nr:uncharacterized protein Z518_00567 [Rhinocladiella mackenziei CBS 650.93]KIX09487.1 hypothetical protein Z518_00567 [Rhinocladiella mackenziei CBS 650.93]